MAVQATRAAAVRRQLAAARPQQLGAISRHRARAPLAICAAGLARRRRNLNVDAALDPRTLACQRLASEELEALAHAARFTADTRALRTATTTDSRVDRDTIVAIVAVDLGRELEAGLGACRHALLALVIAVIASVAIALLVAPGGSGFGATPPTCGTRRPARFTGACAAAQLVSGSARAGRSVHAAARSPGVTAASRAAMLLRAIVGPVTIFAATDVTS